MWQDCMRRTIVLSDSDVMFGDNYMFCEQSKLKIAVNTLRPNNFADDIFKCILLNVNVLISIKISMKFIPKGPFNNIPALVQKMAWCPLWREPAVTGGFPSHEASKAPFVVSFVVSLNKLLNKQSSQRWLETPWIPWRSCGVAIITPHFRGVTWASRRMKSLFVQQLFQANTTGPLRGESS